MILFNSIHILSLLSLADGDILEKLFLLSAIIRSIAAVFCLGFYLLIAFKAASAQLTVFNSLTHCAAGLVFVLAIAESAHLRKLFHVRKSVVQALGDVPHTELSHTGRINDHHAVFEHDQFTMGGGVSALAVVLTDATLVHDLLTRKRVDKARFANARRPKNTSVFPFCK